MKRRASLLLALAVLLGLAAPQAGAEPVMSVFPNTAWTGTLASFEVTLQAPTTSPTITLVLTPRSEVGGPYTGVLAAQGPHGTRFTGRVHLAVDPSGAAPAAPEHQTPAAPGLYDVEVLDADDSPLESCSGCVTLVTKTVPGVAGPAASSVRRLPVGTSVAAVLTGRSFADGTTVDAVTGKGLAGGVTVAAPSALPQGIDTATRITRELAAEETAALGYRDLRITNTDGRTSTCVRCLVVTSLAASVEPVGATNDQKRLVTVRSTGVLPLGAQPMLFWVGADTKDPRDLAGSIATGTSYSTQPGGTPQLVGLFDLVGAAPGPHAYRAGFRLPDGSRHDCEGQCRFSVKQVEPPVVTKLSTLLQRPGTTQSVTVTGTGFTRGTALDLGEGVTVTSVAYRSPTSVVATVKVARDADLGDREVVVSNTDDQSTTFETAYVLAGEPGKEGTAPVPADGDPDLDPQPDLAPDPPLFRLSTSLAAAQQKVSVTGTAEPGAVVDLFAYTQPSTQYRLLRSLNVPEDGRWSASLTPKANTKLYARARNAFGRSQSVPVVLRVRPQLALAAPKRVAAGTCSFAVTVSPARKGMRVAVVALVGGKRQPLGTVVLDASGRGTVTKRFGRAVRALPVAAATGTDLVHVATQSATQRATC